MHSTKEGTWKRTPWKYIVVRDWEEKASKATPNIIFPEMLYNFHRCHPFYFQCAKCACASSLPTADAFVHAVLAANFWPSAIFPLRHWPPFLNCSGTTTWSPRQSIAGGPRKYEQKQRKEKNSTHCKGVQGAGTAHKSNKFVSWELTQRAKHQEKSPIDGINAGPADDTKVDLWSAALYGPAVCEA